MLPWSISKAADAGAEGAFDHSPREHLENRLFATTVEYRDFVKSLKIFAISDHAGERGKGERGVQQGVGGKKYRIKDCSMA